MINSSNIHFYPLIIAEKLILEVGRMMQSDIEKLEMFFDRHIVIEGRFDV